MRPLVEAIKDPTMLLKSDVRKTLPLEVRAVLPRTGLTTWDKWFDAVEALNEPKSNPIVGTLHGNWETLHRGNLQCQSKAAQKIRDSNKLADISQGLTLDLADLQERRRQLGVEEKD
ncbi:hypothetical protein DFH09DRAFT_1330516 [Mycena vulgaris]|nr:hypothetical protein DFH09DRAFT_1330516 [Mycena vulgaris]